MIEDRPKRMKMPNPNQKTPQDRPKTCLLRIIYVDLMLNLFTLLPITLQLKDALTTLRDSIILMRSKLPYLLFIGALTCSAGSACYWQSQRYLQSRARFDTLKQQLNQDSPQPLSQLSQFRPLLYVSVRGQLEGKAIRVDRARGGRTGYLVVKSLKFDKGKIAVVEGWCPSDHEYVQKQEEEKEFRGLLRERQKKDYVSQKFHKEERERYRVNTYIDLDALTQSGGLTKDHLAQNYYLELLQSTKSQLKQDCFPYQYSLDNFELPYLTPDKHLSYAAFWGGSALVGLGAMLRAFRMR